MSKIKTPREKKLASLALDRRNVYGENDKASRKNIPRSKQKSHQALRRAANQPVASLTGHIDEDTAIQAELKTHNSMIEKKRKSFNKRPDAPLGTYLESRDTGN